LTYQNFPHWKFSTNAHGNHNGPQINPNGLGPGEYNFTTYIGEGPKYTMGDRREVDPSNNNPGPGKYSPDDGYTHERAP
jgi:hypothetical protein